MKVFHCFYSIIVSVLFVKADDGGKKKKKKKGCCNNARSYSISFSKKPKLKCYTANIKCYTVCISYVFRGRWWRRGWRSTRRTSRWYLRWAYMSSIKKHNKINWNGKPYINYKHKLKFIYAVKSHPSVYSLNAHFIITNLDIING